MLRHLGANVTEAQERFTPEGGAYGHGRTMGHDHGGAGDHGHAQGHVHHHGGHTHPDDPEPEREPE
jgi:urease accessory protein